MTPHLWSPWAQFNYALDPLLIIIDTHVSHLWDASAICAMDSITEKYQHHAKTTKIIGLNRCQR